MQWACMVMHRDAPGLAPLRAGAVVPRYCGRVSQPSPTPPAVAPRQRLERES